MKRKKKRKHVWRPVAAGFLAVYVLTMGLATWLVKEKFTEDYARRFEENTVYILQKASEREFAQEEEGWKSEELRRDFYQSLANEYLWRTGSKDLQISLGFYDKEKRLIARTRDEIGGNSVWLEGEKLRDYASYGLDDYLSQDEKEELAGYWWENIKNQSPDYPEEYRFSIRTSPGDGNRLWGIYIQRIGWTEESELGPDGTEGWDYEDPLSGGYHSHEMNVMIDYESGEEMTEQIKEFYETDSQIVWQWVNPEIDRATLESQRVTSTYLSLPFLGFYMGSYDGWKRWSRSGYLRNFPEQGEFSWEGVIDQPPLVVDSDGWYYRGKYKLQVGMTGEPFSYMEIRMESSPWAAAADYMKYVYLAGLVLAVVCMAKIIWAFEKVYERQEALEEARRDFTNAIAHELKTPLGVIRNFAENLMEYNMEEKREYYLSQIIGQTEEMDRLVVKMIEVSKLDSGQLVLENEDVDLMELVREQVTRSKPMIQERNLQVQIPAAGEFQVKGDREYLSKAIWNLLCNAVDYNVDGGRIEVRAEKECLVIENTKDSISGEEIDRAFELFYSRDKSRNRKDGHMGMGLFLTKKILQLHGLEVTLENADDRVRAVIKRGGPLT